MTKFFNKRLFIETFSLGLRYILVFAFVFGLDIRVRAVSEKSTHAKVVKKNEKKTTQTSKTEGIQFYSKTYTENINGTYKLLRGVAKVTGAKLQTAFGLLNVYSGEAWVVDRGGGRIILKAIESTQTVRLNDGKVLEIPEGHEIWIGQRDTFGKSTYGMPQMIDLKEHLQFVTKYEDIGFQELRDKAAGLKARWQSRVDLNARLNQEAASRYIASVEEEREQEARKIRQAQLEKQKYRELLHRIVFEK